jgi:hypothetical protein
MCMFKILNEMMVQLITKTMNFCISGSRMLELVSCGFTDFFEI